MPIFDIFSKRQKRLRGEFPDVYQYTVLPREFRNQVVHIFRDVLGDFDNHPTDKAFRDIHQTLCREYGELSLASDLPSRPRYGAVVYYFFLETEDVERALDVIEITLQMAMALQNDWDFTRYSNTVITVESAIGELNQRFREHGIGFQFEGQQIVRVDSQILHREAVRPALYILNRKGFEGPNQEFLRAHDHYRSGRLKEAILEAAKSLESTLKVIAMQRNWSIKETDTAKSLIETLFREGLVPSYMQNQFTSLRAVLESGVPTIRNKEAGHGQGPAAKSIPPYLVAYALHLTAAAIVFLSEANQSPGT